jgi:hypothetical protein
MRYLFVALMLVPLAVWAQADPFDPVQFEKRFHRADKGNKGKLSRQEAYGEFPRMPEFFDEIDANKDNFITLDELRKAVERRVSAAMDASQGASRYGGLGTGNAGAPDVPKGAAPKPQFASKAEERLHYRKEYYEALAGERAEASELGQPVPKSPSSPVFTRPF